MISRSGLIPYYCSSFEAHHEVDLLPRAQSLKTGGPFYPLLSSLAILYPIHDCLLAVQDQTVTNPSPLTTVVSASRTTHLRSPHLLLSRG